MDQPSEARDFEPLVLDELAIAWTEKPVSSIGTLTDRSSVKVETSHSYSLRETTVESLFGEAEASVKADDEAAQIVARAFPDSDDVEFDAALARSVSGTSQIVDGELVVNSWITNDGGNMPGGPIMNVTKTAKVQRRASEAPKHAPLEVPEISARVDAALGRLWSGPLHGEALQASMQWLLDDLRQATVPDTKLRVEFNDIASAMALYKLATTDSGLVADLPWFSVAAATDESISRTDSDDFFSTGGKLGAATNGMGATGWFDGSTEATLRRQIDHRSIMLPRLVVSADSGFAVDQASEAMRRIEDVIESALPPGTKMYVGWRVIVDLERR